MKFRGMNIATNGQAYTGQSIHVIFLNKTLSRRPGVKDINDWIIFLEYDALSHYTFFTFLIQTRNR
jgi:hypothetical protein